MKLLIFTEGGKNVGYGHIYRCCSLYDEAVKMGVEVSFFIDGSKEVLKVLGNRKVILGAWNDCVAIKNYDISDSICIVDSYRAQLSTYEYIYKEAKLLVNIDDYNRINYPGGVVISPAFNNEKIDYENKNIKVLSGCEYVLLRSEFQGVQKKLINKQIKELLIILGGSDFRNITPQLVHVLKEYPFINKSIVIGNGYVGEEELLNIIDDSFRVFKNLNATEMKEIMIGSDLAITAAGQTIYELLCTGTPFIPIEIIDNQINNVRGLLINNLVDFVLKWDDEHLRTKLVKEIEKLKSYEKRSEMAIQFQCYVDGLGITRIMGILLGDELWKNQK